MPRKNPKPEDHVECFVTMRSWKNKDHTHTCIGNCKDNNHFCGLCREWWGKKMVK